MTRRTASLHARVALSILMVLAMDAGGQETASAALQSYQRARTVLDAGVDAMGGAVALASIRCVRRDLSDSWIDPSQGSRPWHGDARSLPPANSGFDRTAVMSFIDYADNRWLETQRYVDSPKEYALILDAVMPGRGFRSITYIEEKPYYDVFPTTDLAPQTTRKFRRHPEGILRMALARPETLGWVGEASVAGRGQEVISFADSLGTRICLYFDSWTHLLTKAETLRDHPVVGDTTTETTFSDYRAVGDVKLPFRYLDRSAGLPTRDQELAKIEINAAFPDERFQAPADFVTVKHDPESPQLHKISEALYLIRGTYNVMFSVFPDDVVIFEAPLSDAYTQEILRIVRSVAGSKPIRYVVASHFHYDHIAGLRTVVSEGIPILTTPDAREVIEKSSEVRRTMRPDALSRMPGKPIIETVMNQRVLDQDGVRARVYDFGPAPHVGQLLVAYFPDEKLLYVADLMDVLTEELVIAGVDAVPMRQKIQQLGLQVEHFVPVHGFPITGEQFEQAYRIRAKYLP